MAKIQSVRFEKESRWDPVKIYATFSDDSEEFLFSYFDDEIYFDESELIGLTEEEAHDLFHRKDVAYLRS